MSPKSFVNLVADLISRTDADETEVIAKLILESGNTGGRIYIAGNGGSAATAQHFYNDLTGVSLKHRKYDIAPVCLASNMSLFSAMANDYGYDNVFQKQVEGRIGATDLLVLFSVSGSSTNCVEVARYAWSMGAVVISLLGFDGGLLSSISDHKIIVHSENYFAVESCHLLLAHAITERINQAFSLDGRVVPVRAEVKAG